MGGLGSGARAPKYEPRPRTATSWSASPGAGWPRGRTRTSTAPSSTRKKSLAADHVSTTQAESARTEVNAWCRNNHHHNNNSALCKHAMATAAATAMATAAAMAADLGDGGETVRREAAQLGRRLEEGGKTHAVLLLAAVQDAAVHGAVERPEAPGARADDCVLG